VLDRHGRRLQHALKDMRVQPEQGHGQSKQDRREEIPVLGLLIEQRRMLNDGQATRPNA
jgi:hypothetical protein